MRHLIAFLLGVSAGVGAVLAWAKSGHDVTVGSVASHLQPAQAAASSIEHPELPPLEHPADSTLIADNDFFYGKGEDEIGRPPRTGDTRQDGLDDAAISKWDNAGGTIAGASRSVILWILKRESKYICLGCGEPNPASERAGYPKDSCHRCRRDLNYPNVVQNSVATTASDYSAIGYNEYLAETSKRHLMQLTAADRERFLATVESEWKRQESERIERERKAAYVPDPPGANAGTVVRIDASKWKLQKSETMPAESK